MSCLSWLGTDTLNLNLNLNLNLGVFNPQIGLKQQRFRLVTVTKKSLCYVRLSRYYALTRSALKGTPSARRDSSSTWYIDKKVHRI